MIRRLPPLALLLALAACDAGRPVAPAPAAGSVTVKLLLTLVPDREAGRFFSLMLLSSRAASFIGPLVWGYTVDGLLPSMGTGFAYRAGVFTVLVFFVGSLFVLKGVPNRHQRVIAP